MKPRFDRRALIPGARDLQIDGCVQQAEAVRHVLDLDEIRAVRDK